MLWKYVCARGMNEARRPPCIGTYWHTWLQTVAGRLREPVLSSRRTHYGRVSNPVHSFLLAPWPGQAVHSLQCTYFGWLRSQ